MIAKILFQHQGSSLDSNHSPLRPFVDGADEALLEKKCWRMANMDFDMPIEINEYKLVTVELPDWASAEDYCNVCFTVNLKYYKGFGGDIAWGRQWFLRLVELPEALRYSCIALLRVKNFRSSFRQSLRNQLEAWLNADKPEHFMPFSQRQADVLVTERDIRAAKNCATNLYHTR